LSGANHPPRLGIGNLYDFPVMLNRGGANAICQKSYLHDSNLRLGLEQVLDRGHAGVKQVAILTQEAHKAILIAVAEALF
jgi:hypothetical protein